MIYITGDIHIPTTDISKLNTKRFPAQKQLTKSDYVMICGDFGGVWDDSPEVRYWIKWLEAKPFTTLFVDGNHENFDLLAGYEAVDFCGGKARKITDSIYHLMRGQIYTIQGKTFFTLGGASSHDKERRKQGVSWWSEELPSTAELETARANLQAVGNSVDYIITHCAPSSVQERISSRYAQDRLTNFLEEVKNTASFKGWYFGHYHTDKIIDDRFFCMFNDIKLL